MSADDSPPGWCWALIGLASLILPAAAVAALAYGTWQLLVIPDVVGAPELGRAR